MALFGYSYPMDILGKIGDWQDRGLGCCSVAMEQPDGLGHGLLMEHPHASKHQITDFKDPNSCKPLLNGHVSKVQV
jgi:hypothetical protein